MCYIIYHSFCFCFSLKPFLASSCPFSLSQFSSSTPHTHPSHFRSLSSCSPILFGSLPCTKWRVTVYSCGLCPPDSIFELNHAPSLTHTHTSIHTEEGLSAQSFICLLYGGFKMESACIRYAVSHDVIAMRNMDHDMARQLNHFSFVMSFLQKAKLHAALQERNRLNLELINHQLKASRYDQVSHAFRVQIACYKDTNTHC